MRRLCSISLVLLFVSGCGYLNREVPNLNLPEPDISTAGAGAVAGAAVGGGLGAVVGSMSGEVGKGLIIGSVAGATAGGVIGHSIEEQKVAMNKRRTKLQEQEQIISNQRRSIDSMRRGLKDEKPREEDLLGSGNINNSNVGDISQTKAGSNKARDAASEVDLLIAQHRSSKHAQASSGAQTGGVGSSGGSRNVKADGNLSDAELVSDFIADNSHKTDGNKAGDTIKSNAINTTAVVSDSNQYSRTRLASVEQTATAISKTGNKTDKGSASLKVTNSQVAKTAKTTDNNNLVTLESIQPIVVNSNGDADKRDSSKDIIADSDNTDRDDTNDADLDNAELAGEGMDVSDSDNQEGGSDRLPPSQVAPAIGAVANAESNNGFPPAVQAVDGANAGSVNTATANVDAGGNTNCELAGKEVDRARRATSDGDKLFYFRRAMRLCPNNATYHLEVAHVYSELGRKNDAKIEFKRVVELDPNNAEAKEQLSLLAD